MKWKLINHLKRDSVTELLSFDLHLCFNTQMWFGSSDYTYESTIFAEEGSTSEFNIEKSKLPAGIQRVVMPLDRATDNEWVTCAVSMTAEDIVISLDIDQGTGDSLFLETF